MGLKRVSNGSRMGLKRVSTGLKRPSKWVSNGSQMSLKWIPNGSQISLNLVSNESKPNWVSFKWFDVKCFNLHFKQTVVCTLWNYEFSKPTKNRSFVIKKKCQFSEKGRKTKKPFLKAMAKNRQINFAK